MNNTIVARVAFDFDKRNKEEYYFNIPEKLEKSTLKNNEILIIDTILGARFGYFNYYADKTKLDFEPDRLIVARNECTVPYELNDEFFNLEGFILLEVDENQILNKKYIQYDFKDKGIVGILNHMVVNNVTSAYVKSTPREFEHVTPHQYFSIKLCITDASSEYETDGLLCKFTSGDKITLVYYEKFNKEMMSKLEKIISKEDVMYFGDRGFDIDCKSIRIYGRDIYDIIDKYMKMTRDISYNYFHAFRKINSTLLNNTESTFGYIINSNYESANVFEFRSTEELGVYLPYFILKHGVDSSILGQGYDDDDDIED